MSVVRTKSDGIICGTTYCCYVIGPKKSCHNIIDNLNYCIHSVKTGETLDTVDEFERGYYPEKSDCVSIFEKVIRKIAWYLLLKLF